MLVASGTPLAGYEVIALSGTADIGPLVISAPAVGLNGETGQPCAGSDGLATGDLGFLEDGWLYVVGRDDDYLVVNGRNIFAPTIESVVGDLTDVRSGRVAAVGLPTGEWVILFEAASATNLSAADSQRIRRNIRRVVSGTMGVFPDDVVLIPRGTLPITSSGKLRRRDITDVAITHR
jgi:fatty-acyl-CoA synthase